MKKTFSIFALVLLSLVLALTSSAQSIKPGTEIRVQLLSSLNTGKAESGQEFAATLADPVQMDDGALWPKGTEIKGKIVDVVSSGRLSRPASISLQLVQIGKSPVRTETAKLDGQSHGARNAALIGGIAAVGAVLGGIANGGKGALIGAAAGATAGTATAAATGKQEIVLPAETFITFVVAGANDVQVTQIAPQIAPPPPPAAPVQAVQEEVPPSDPYAYEAYTPDQLDNLVAPVALYPDPLLAQLLLAATFPDQIEDAAQWVNSRNPNDIDYQPWDVSVRAVAHYPAIVSMLNDRLDWTTALGQAYIYQSTDVMESVQHLRNLAYSQGNLVTTPQQQVVFDRGTIEILPAQPRVIYAPVYDPGVIYVRHVYRPEFGAGFVIGAWLNYDMDWGGRRVVYQDWSAPRDGWRVRSRPYVQVTNVYVDHRYETVRVNQTVMNRHVNYENVERYNSVHHDVSYDNHVRFEANRARQEPSRPAPQGWNGRENERDATNRPRPPEQRPELPRPADAGLRRANPEPPRAEPIPPQPMNSNDRNRGFSNRGWQGQRNAPQPQRPDDAGSNRRIQPASVAEPVQPPAVRGDVNNRNVQPQPAQQAPAPAPAPQIDNRNDRGNDRGFRNGPTARPELPAPSARAVAPQQPPQAENRNDRANERGGFRNAPPERQQETAPPARIVSAPQPSQPAPAAAPAVVAAPAPAVAHQNDQPRGQQAQQPQQAHDNGNHKDNGNHGNGNRGRDEENGKDKK